VEDDSDHSDMDEDISEPPTKRKRLVNRVWVKKNEFDTPAAVHEDVHRLLFWIMTYSKFFELQHLPPRQMRENQTRSSSTRLYSAVSFSLKGAPGFLHLS